MSLTQCTANFETGVAAANLAATDPGSATAFQAVTPSGGYTFTYDSSIKHSGSLSAVCVNPGVAGTCYALWDSTVHGTNSTVTEYGRAYMYFEAFPSNTVQPFIFINAALSATCCRIQVNTTGITTLLNSAGTTIATFTNAVSVGQWIRMEWSIFPSTTVGVFEVKLFNSAESTTATETQTVNNAVLAANVGALRFGTGSGNTNNTKKLYFDDVVFGATAYPGPTPPAFFLDQSPGVAAINLGL